MSSPAAGAAPGRALRVAVPVAAGVVVVDQLAKHWAVGSLGARPRHVWWTLQWNLSYNRGMAFSTGQNAGVLIGLVALAVVAAVVVALARQRVTPGVVAVAAGLVIGGALGNVADRLFRGRGWLHGSVVDFIDFQWFPIFNLADAAINVGAALYLIWAVVADRRSPARSDAP